MNNKYYLIMGIEVHCQLKTQTKLFSNASNIYFNNHPNSNITAIDLGAPGALPVVNKRAVELAILAGLLFNMKINNILRFDRKNYFYPDLPKGYQITQYYEPLCKDGKFLEVVIDKLFIEEDTAKQIHTNQKTYIDYNRCGAPLIEIVTAPIFNFNANEMVEWVKKFINVLKELNITAGNLHEGDMRFDVNISLTSTPNKLSNYKIEIKNLNSLKNIEKAIRYEITRQEKLLNDNQTILSETRRFDEKTQTTILMRKKFSLNDYKFFSEPSILPIYLEEIIDEQTKCFSKHVLEKTFIDVYKGANTRSWIKTILEAQNNLNKAQFLQNSNLFIESLNDIDQKLFFNNPLKATNVATIQSKFEKYYSLNIFEIDKTAEILQNWKSELLIVDDSIDIKSIIQKIVEKFPNVVADYKLNPTRIEKFIMGSVFKETKGKVSPNKVIQEIKNYFL